MAGRRGRGCCFCGLAPHQAHPLRAKGDLAKAAADDVGCAGHGASAEFDHSQQLDSGGKAAVGNGVGDLLASFVPGGLFTSSDLLE